MDNRHSPFSRLSLIPRSFPRSITFIIPTLSSLALEVKFIKLQKRFDVTLSTRSSWTIPPLVPIRDDNGITVSHRTIKEDRKEIAALLLRNKADAKAKRGECNAVTRAIGVRVRVKSLS